MPDSPLCALCGDPVDDALNCAVRSQPLGPTPRHRIYWHHPCEEQDRRIAEVPSWQALVAVVQSRGPGRVQRQGES